jgi:hypothetical protein
MSATLGVFEASKTGEALLVGWSAGMWGWQLFTGPVKKLETASVQQVRAGKRKRRFRDKNRISKVRARSWTTSGTSSEITSVVSTLKMARMRNLFLEIGPI